MREFALMRAGGSQRKMAVSRPFFRSFLQPFSIWLICSQSPPQFSPRRRLCAVMHSWRLCVCLSVCFNRFWKCAHRILMHRRSWVAFFRVSLFLSLTHWILSVLSVRSLTCPWAFVHVRGNHPVCPMVSTPPWAKILLRSPDSRGLWESGVHYKLQTVSTSMGPSVCLRGVCPHHTSVAAKPLWERKDGVRTQFTPFWADPPQNN